MPEWIVPVAVPILLTIIINLASVYLARSQREKNKSDAASSITGSAVTLVQRWEKRVQELEAKVDELEERVDVLEKENRCLRIGAERLEGQVVSLGHRPVFSLRELEAQMGGKA